MLTNRSDSVKTRPTPPDQGIAVNQEQFWQFWEEHESFLMTLCVNWMNGDRAEAREALSGAMMRALEGTPEKLHVIGNVRAWLARIARNHCMDLLRQQKRLPYKLEDPDRILEQLDVGLQRVEASPETGLLHQESYQQVRAELEALPTRLREVMILRAYQNMPFKDIARHLCISPANARKRATEARALLANRLDRDQNEARAPRSPHSGAAHPRAERHAAEAVLEKRSTAAPPVSHYAHPCEIQLNGDRSIERFVFLARRPGRIRQRLRTLENYMLRHPTGWAKCREYADLLCTEGRYQEAVEHYQEVLVRQTHRYLVSESLARCLHLLERSLEAQEVLQQALANISDPAHAAHLRALKAHCAGDHLHALAAWKKACELAPNHLNYGLARAQQLLYLGKAGEARLLLQAHLHRHPMDRKGHAFLLNALQQGHHKAEYAHTLEHVQRKFPNDLLASAQSVIFQLRTQKPDRTQLPVLRKQVSAVQAQWPKAALNLNLQACWLHFRGKNDEAHHKVQQFVAAKPLLREGLQYAIHWMNILGDKKCAKAYSQQLHRAFPETRTELTPQRLLTWPN